MKSEETNHGLRFVRTVRGVFLGVAALVLFAPRADAQKLAVKANALSWFTTTPQAEVEGAVGARWTVGLAGSWNPWKFGDNKKFKHWELRPMGRYWLWEAFNGHFFGLSGEYGQYNVGGMRATPFGLMFSDTDRKRYEGSFVGAGLSYGYVLPFARHWAAEFTVGAGYVHTKYDTYYNIPNGARFEKGRSYNYWGLTKVGINLVYRFGK